MPIGSTEQHGPTGLIGTDSLCAELLANAVGQECGALVAPALPIGMAQHHLGFPGSMTLRPSTLLEFVKDVVMSLAKHGFEHFYFINGHGGNNAPVLSAFAELYAESSLRPERLPKRRIRCKLRNWWVLEPVVEAAAQLFGDAEGHHATCSELALTFYAHPEKERCELLEPRRAPVGAFYDCDDYRRRFPDGRIGSDPSLATAATGKRIHEVAVQALVEDYQAFVSKNAGD